MDLFNLKRVEELEKKLSQLEGIRDENERLRREIVRVENDLRDLVNLKAEMPEDCVPGKYCESCTFGKAYFKNYHVSGSGPFRTHDRAVAGYICNKANVCKNFIQKKIDEE